MNLDFLRPTQFIDMILDFDKETKKTIFHFKGYHNNELTSDREYRIALTKQDIEKIINSFEQIKELLK